MWLKGEFSMVKVIQTKQSDVTLAVFTSDESSFLVTSTLVIKNGHALLINAKFTQSDASEIVTYLETNNLILDEIFILHGDPDYYFGLETIKAAYPNAIAYATQSSVEHITHSVLSKLKVWNGVLGDNAPKNIVLPKIYTDSSIEFQGLTFELTGLNSHRTNLYNEDLALLLGGIDTFNEVHLFLADTKTKEEMLAWVESLRSLQELNVEIIVPSHGLAEKSFDRSLLSATITYLMTAIQAADTSNNSTEFIEKLNSAYPEHANKNVLGLSAKVVMKEMPWG